MKPQLHYRLRFYAKTVATTSLVCPKNERQRSVNDCWPCISDNPRAQRRYQHIIELSAVFLGKNAIDVRARTPAFGLMDIRVVIIGIRLQPWMRVIVGVDV